MTVALSNCIETAISQFSKLDERAWIFERAIETHRPTFDSWWSTTAPKSQSVGSVLLSAPILMQPTTDSTDKFAFINGRGGRRNTSGMIRPWRHLYETWHLQVTLPSYLHGRSKLFSKFNGSWTGNTALKPKRLGYKTRSPSTRDERTQLSQLRVCQPEGHNYGVQSVPGGCGRERVRGRARALSNVQPFLQIYSNVCAIVERWYAPHSR